MFVYCIPGFRCILHHTSIYNFYSCTGERFVILVIFVSEETVERSRSTNGVLFRHQIYPGKHDIWHSFLSNLTFVTPNSGFVSKNLKGKVSLLAFHNFSVKSSKYRKYQNVLLYHIFAHIVSFAERKVNSVRKTAV